MKAGAGIDLVIGVEIVRIEEVARRQRAPVVQQRSLSFYEILDFVLCVQLGVSVPKVVHADVDQNRQSRLTQSHLANAKACHQRKASSDLNDNFERQQDVRKRDVMQRHVIEGSGVACYRGEPRNKKYNPRSARPMVIAVACIPPLLNRFGSVTKTVWLSSIIFLMRSWR